MTLAIDALNEARAWAAVVRELAGDRRPLAPAGPRGRVHRCADEPLTATEREALLRDPSVKACEAALILCITRQRVHQLRHRARQPERTTP